MTARRPGWEERARTAGRVALVFLVILGIIVAIDHFFELDGEREERDPPPVVGVRPLPSGPASAAAPATALPADPTAAGPGTSTAARPTVRSGDPRAVFARSLALRAPGPADSPPHRIPHSPDVSTPVPQVDDGPPYDGRFTFLRVRFVGGGSGMRSGFFGGRRGPPWSHDMPRAERNFAQILAETTTMRPYMDGGRVLSFEDPELFRYPIAYIVEVGYWSPSETEVRNLREYLLKGGFLIVDEIGRAHV